MVNNWTYFNIELLYNNNIIISNSLPKIIFDFTTQEDLVNVLNEIFDGITSEDLKIGLDGIPNNTSLWDSVSFYLTDNVNEINKITKTKNQMDQYPSYADGILLIFNDRLRL